MPEQSSLALQIRCSAGRMSLTTIMENMFVQFLNWSAVNQEQPDAILCGILPRYGGDKMESIQSWTTSNDLLFSKPCSLQMRFKTCLADPK